MSEKSIWTFLVDKLGNEYGAAGLMGNLYAESGLIANNLQNSYQKKLGFTDKTYTEAVDSGAYENFANDAAGYGLAQWTYWTRKRDLLAFAKRKGRSIGNEAMQLEYLMDELARYFSPVLATLRIAQSVKEASDIVLTQFERPANMSEQNKVRRANLGQAFYDKYATKEVDELAVYKTINDVPAWGKPTIKKLMDKGALKGTDTKGTIDVDDTYVRVMVTLDRLGKLG